MRIAWVSALTVGFLLACGGGGGGSGDVSGSGEGSGGGSAAVAAVSQYGSVEFQTYKCDTSYYKFNNSTSVTTTWNNMACSPVKGTYTHEGDIIKIVFKDVEDCMTWDTMELKQMSSCALAEYKRTNPQTGEVVDDDPWMFERTEPRCPR